MSRSLSVERLVEALSRRPASFDGSAGRRWRLVPCCLSAAAAAAILAVTLAPLHAPGGMEPLSLSLRFRGVRGLADSIANVLLFVPLGIAVAACRRDWRWPVVVGLTLSLFIELAQILVPGRYSSVWDVLFNVAGTAIGMALVRTAPTWLRPHGPLLILLPIVAVAAGLTVLIGGAALLQPRTAPGILIGQWTPAFAGSPRYTGRILEAQVGTVPVPPRPIRDSDALRTALFRDTIELLVEAALPPAGKATLFAVAAPGYQSLFSIAIDGVDVVVGYRTRAFVAGLDQPDIRVTGALAGIAPGESFRLRFWWAGADRCLKIDDVSFCGLGFSAADTWALLIYPVPAPLRGPLPFLWAAALLLPAGFWIRGTERALVVSCAVAAATASAPWMVNTHPAGWGVCAAAAAGILMGHAIRSVNIKS